MRNATLHRRLEAFSVEASGRLAAEVAAGAEMPFEVIEERSSGRAALYRYEPLTGAFIRRRAGLLAGVSTHREAADALAGCPGLGSYLAQRGELRVPEQVDAQADAVLIAFLEAMFAQRSEFGFEPAHFEAAYSELEHALYEGHCAAIVIAPVLGVALDPGTTELVLEDGLSLIAGDALGDAPAEAVWGEAEEPSVLAILAVQQERAARAPVALARARFARVLSALRLLAPGAYALGPVGWARTEAGRWRPVGIAVGGRPGRLTLIGAAREEELRAFYDLVSRRMPGEQLGWAMHRYELGCERRDPAQALTDYLLALRALLEPEGPDGGLLPQRLAAICARPEERAELARRTADAIGLEHDIVNGRAGADEPLSQEGQALVRELAEHLRAILRDALCGHLERDLRAVADGLLAEAAAVATPAR